MKLASYLIEGTASFGVVDHDLVHDLGPVFGAGVPDLKALIASDGIAQVSAKLAEAKSVPLADVTLLPVVPNPGKIFCVGHNYERIARKPAAIRRRILRSSSVSPIAKPRTISHC